MYDFNSHIMLKIFLFPIFVYILILSKLYMVYDLIGQGRLNSFYRNHLSTDFDTNIMKMKIFLKMKSDL